MDRLSTLPLMKGEGAQGIRGLPKGSSGSKHGIAPDPPSLSDCQQLNVRLTVNVNSVSDMLQITIMTLILISTFAWYY